MKKLIEKRNGRLRLFGLIMLCAFALVTVFMAPLAAGVMAATLALPVGIDLTDKEKAAMQAVVEAVNKEVDRLSKGYITEAKFSELTTAAIKEYLKENEPSKAKILELENALKTQGLEILSLKEGKRETLKSFGQNVAEAYKANVEAIKAIKTKQGGMIALRLRTLVPCSEIRMSPVCLA